MADFDPRTILITLGVILLMIGLLGFAVSYLETILPAGN